MVVSAMHAPLSSFHLTNKPRELALHDADASYPLPKLRLVDELVPGNEVGASQHVFSGKDRLLHDPRGVELPLAADNPLGAEVDTGRTSHDANPTRRQPDL